MLEQKKKKGERKKSLIGINVGERGWSCLGLEMKNGCHLAKNIIFILFFIYLLGRTYTVASEERRGGGEDRREEKTCICLILFPCLYHLLLNVLGINFKGEVRESFTYRLAPASAN